MGDFATRVMTNADHEFYPTLGPYLSRRTVVAELGGPVWDDDDKTWFVVMVAGQLAGFSAVTLALPVATLCSAYVLPEFRGQGVYHHMLAERVSYAHDHGAQILKTTATPTSRNTLLSAGFATAGRRGKYTLLEMRMS